MHIAELEPVEIYTDRLSGTLQLTIGSISVMPPLLQSIAHFNPVTSFIRLVEYGCFAGPFYLFDLSYPAIFTWLMIVVLFLAYYIRIHRPGKNTRRYLRRELS